MHAIRYRVKLPLHNIVLTLLGQIAPLLQLFKVTSIFLVEREYSSLDPCNPVNKSKVNWTAHKLREL